MFCSQCGNNIKEGSQFCEVCGAKVRIMPNAAQGSGIKSGTKPSPENDIPSGKSAADAIKARMNAPAGQNAHVQPRMAGSGPANINRNLGGAKDDAGKKKSKTGLIVAGAGVAAIVIFGVSRLGDHGGGGEPYINPLSSVESDVSSYGNNESGQINITVNAYDTGSIAPEIDEDADRVEALIELAKRLEQSGDKEAAMTVYSMIPRTALGQAAGEEREELEASASGGLQTYFAYSQAKDMYASVFGKEDGQ